MIGLVDVEIGRRAGAIIFAHRVHPRGIAERGEIMLERAWIDGFENLFLVGRNGMHKYNNQDHSMLTAMAVVDGIATGYVDKDAVWGINSEQEYHEEKK